MFSPIYFLCLAALWIVFLPLSWRHLESRGHRLLPRALILVLVGGLLVGTTSHGFDLARAGAIPLPEQPLGFNIYWTSLVILDPLGALLLVFRPHWGVLAVLGIMASDVAVNLAAFGNSGVLAPENVMLQFQIGYALFAVLAAPWILRSADRPPGDD